ncbi:hypothetical protein GSI_05143 [Ganoderma sinense ZZ0214-1]|uniref:HNH nuclease domain-containing protein n=1 Tax=Ganoderma sinense ZZ0214-1 TaxID=1077348 RepID=A0A2G8SFC2_9APHY|nr:hypothetical protein GSI_05143 [Ganoderma sinense ZZ0214-1]
MDVREEFVPLSGTSQLEILASGSVFIKHPGVGKSLFCFPAYSYPKRTHTAEIPFGVLHLLALDACRVITNHTARNRNQTDFLAQDREGKTRVPIGTVELLAPGDYYYFLGPATDAANSNYAIVNDFSAFRFPDRIPDHWYDTRPSARLRRGMGVAAPEAMSVHVVERDQHCTITKLARFNKCVHLVPKSEAAWFAANEMHVYSIENQKAGVDTHTNGISLRDDVHRCFEAGAFVFYPVPSSDKFMAYFVDDGYWPDYTELFHQRLALIHPSVAVEFLYARFAYTVINLWRPSMFFDCAPNNPEVQVAAAQINSFAEKAGKIQGPATRSGTEDPELASVDESRNTQMDQASEYSLVSRSDRETDTVGSSLLNHSMQSPPQDSFTEGDERWRKRLFTRIPEMATLDEVEDPPDVVDCHSETPHMLRLTSRYMKENPQVWRTSTTPEGATRGDDEGWYAAWMTRPL